MGFSQRLAIIITALVAGSFGLEYLAFGSIEVDSIWTILRGIWLGYLVLGEVFYYLEIMWDFMKWVWSWFMPEKKTDDQ